MLSMNAIGWKTDPSKFFSGTNKKTSPFLVKKLEDHQCKLEFGNFCLLSRSICCPLFFYFSKCVSSRLLLLQKRCGFAFGFGFGFGFSGFGIQCWCPFGECSTGRVNYNITKVTKKDQIRKPKGDQSVVIIIVSRSFEGCESSKPENQTKTGKIWKPHHQDNNLLARGN